MIPADIEQSIPQRFESRVEETPDRIAVDDGHQSWTYAELDARANRIAHGILGLCGPANKTVALLIDHGAPLVAAILGSLKAGKIYVALDPTDPSTRLETTIAAARPQLIVTDSANSPIARSFGQAMLIDSLDARGFHDQSPNLLLSPDTLAYVFFTSGSTGAPKGVVDNHRNVLHNVLRYTTNLGIDSRDRLTLLQSCAFSGSVSSLFCALLNGATSYPFDLRRRGIGRLGEWIDGNGITVYHSVPSIFRGITRSERGFPTVRIVRLEGDKAVPADVALFRGRFSNECMLAIGLGATETGLSCQHILRGPEPAVADTVPIGLPAMDMTISIVDDNGKELGRGEHGEIVVRSRYLAVGYWERADLTAEAFHECANGERSYRTGDTGMIRTDGRVEYLGRKDYRVKIRGNTVEPDVVERALVDTGAVREAAVAGRFDARGEQRLVAWVVPSNGDARTALRARLSAVLPPYMVPSAFIQIEAMPLSDNGKLDRKALLDPLGFDDDSQREIVEPRNAFETQLLRLWHGALSRQSISVNDDFFEVGGDSLSAVQLAIDIEQQFDTRFLPSQLFAYPTIAALANELAKPDDGIGPPPLVCLQARGGETPFFCVHPGNGDCLVYRKLAALMAPDRPFHAFQAEPPRPGEPIATGIREIARSYAARVKQVQAHGPYLIGGYCYGAFVALEIARELDSDGAPATVVCFDTDGEDRLVLSIGDATAIHLRRLARLTWHERFRYVVERAAFRGDRMLVQMMASASWVLARMGVTPSRVLRAAELHDRRFRRARQYRPQPWDGRLIYFHPQGRSYVDPLTFWSGISRNGITLVTVPGDGSAMFDEPHVAELAARLRAVLSRGRGSEARTLENGCGPPYSRSRHSTQSEGDSDAQKRSPSGHVVRVRPHRLQEPGAEGR